METNVKVILLDMDEVICDFTGGVCKLWGFSRAELEQHREFGEWDITPAMSRLLGVEVSHAQFWDRLNAAGSGFWYDLHELPWTEELLCLLNRRAIPFHIVSGPSLCPTSHEGKVRWIRKRFGKSFDRFALTPHKELFARPGAMLIDDREDNCTKFRGGYTDLLSQYHPYTGGAATIFPSTGNRFREYAHDPIWFLRQTPLFKGF